MRLDDVVHQPHEHGGKRGTVAVVLLEQVEQVLSYTGVRQCRDLGLARSRQPSCSHSSHSLHLKLNFAAVQLGDFFHKLQHVVEHLHGIGKNPGIVRGGLKVLHDPAEVCHDIVLNDVLRQDVSDVPGLHVSRLEHHQDGFNLLCQRPQCDQEVRGVDVGELTVLADPSCDELDHVEVYGSLDRSDVEQRGLLWFLPCSRSQRSSLVVTVKLEDPGHEIEHSGAVIDSRIPDAATRRRGAQEANQGTERSPHEFLEELPEVRLHCSAYVLGSLEVTPRVWIQLVVLPNRALLKVYEEGVVEHVLLLGCAGLVLEFPTPEHPTFAGTRCCLHSGGNTRGTQSRARLHGSAKRPVS
mmetsp:Transcript_58944/g.127500  ORF Transcript_58944/g.127500 Transcript_58944/m.127500 type:complete len:354 (-) Transcript_58944:900-1961(-)